MANETVTQDVTENEQEERTFTQAEVDALVQDRIWRDRAKYADYDELKEKATKYDEAVEASKSELQRAQERADALQAQLDTMTQAEAVRKIRENVATDTGVPMALLTGSNEEECIAQAQAILAFAKPDYPNVRDAGELQKSQKKDVTQQFADWFTSNTR